MRSAKEEIIAILSSANAFIRQIKDGNDQIILEAAKHRKVSVTILTPMDENVKTIANDLEKQCHNIKIRKIEPSSPRSTVTAVITDWKFSLAAELRDDSKSKASEAIGDIIYSTSKPTVLSAKFLYMNWQFQLQPFQNSLIINGLGLTSPNALIHPLEHICTDLNMYLSKVDLYEKAGKLALEQAEELRQAETAINDELAC